MNGANAALLAEYRCRTKGCLLLRVWQTPTGPEWSKPKRRLSGLYAMLRDFHDAGVAGVAMPASAGQLDGCAAHTTVPVACEHVRDRLRIGDIRQAITGRTPDRPARIALSADTTRRDDPHPGVW
jgi:hypothetical protein